MVRPSLATFAVGITLAALSTSCKPKLKPEECATTRKEAFEILNKAQPCATDPDCHQSSWPGCEKPSNQKTLDAIKPIHEKFTNGQCEDPKPECRAAPEVYCKQGLCVHREKGIVPSDEIQIQ